MQGTTFAQQPPHQTASSIPRREPSPLADDGTLVPFPQIFPPPPGGAGQGPRAGAAPPPPAETRNAAGPVFLGRGRRKPRFPGPGPEKTEGRRECKEGGDSTKETKQQAENGLNLTVSDGQERYFALIGDLNGLHQALVDSFDALASASQAAHDLADTLGFALVPANPEAIAALQEEARQPTGPTGGPA